MRKTNGPTDWGNVAFYLCLFLYLLAIASCSATPAAASTGNGSTHLGRIGYYCDLYRIEERGRAIYVAVGYGGSPTACSVTVSP